MGKRKTYRSFGKTTKQWNRLYESYKTKAKARGLRLIDLVGKKDFKKTYSELKTSGSKNVNKTIVKDTKKLNEFEIYLKKYNIYKRKGYILGDVLSEEEYKVIKESYASERNVPFAIAENSLFTSKLQAKNLKLHYDMLGLTKKAKTSDFYKNNEITEAFWSEIEARGGWDQAFNYGD